jgi:branched-chain amino acid transport system permease protein
MATIGLTYFLIGLGESIFGGEPKKMIAEELGLPTGSTTFESVRRYPDHASTSMLPRW